MGEEAEKCLEDAMLNDSPFDDDDEYYDDDEDGLFGDGFCFSDD